MKQVRPTLVVRCMDKRTDVFVYTDSAARIEEQDENHTVRVAFDGDEGAHERWPDSVEHDALFAPDGKAMAGRILASRQMRFTFSPHNAAPVTATFEVGGALGTAGADRETLRAVGQQVTAGRRAWSASLGTTRGGDVTPAPRCALRSAATRGRLSRLR